MNRAIGVCKIVRNLEKIEHFFIHVFGCKKIQEIDVEGKAFDLLFQLKNVKAKLVCLQFQKETLWLIEFFSPKTKPYPLKSRSNDLWFLHFAIVVSDMDQAFSHLQKHRIKSISSSPQTIPKSNTAAAGIRAFYFRSPNRHPLEIIFFPKGKGHECWQKLKKCLFMGIDHIAIVVSNTKKSLEFYCKKLGMKVIGKSLNFGKEQEALSGVLGAKVKITTLHFGEKMGKEVRIELLEYLHPKTGRKKNKEKTYNLSESQILIKVDDLEEIRKKIGKKQADILHMPKEFPARQMLSASDPDGHRILFF